MKDLTFLNEMEQFSGENISACYQCYKCTVGCPIVAQMDIYPHRIIRYIILGEREKTLTSKTIWTCLQCMTCSVRCPNEIDIAHVFATLRKISIQEGKAAQKDTYLFDELFLHTVRKHGRLHEIEAILKYKLKTKTFFDDAKMGMSMFSKGRIGLLPHNIQRKAEIQNIFKRLKTKVTSQG